MTITEFLTARLDEEEAAARAAQGEPGSGDFSWWDVDYNSVVAEAHGARWKPERVLAEVEAKRAIMAEHGDTHECSGPSGGLTFDPALQGDDWGGPCNTLCHFAQPYASHPDFDPAWRL